MREELANYSRQTYYYSLYPSKSNKITMDIDSSSNLLSHFKNPFVLFISLHFTLHYWFLLNHTHISSDFVKVNRFSQVSTIFVSTICIQHSSITKIKRKCNT